MNRAPLAPRRFAALLAAVLAAVIVTGPTACGPPDDSPRGLYREHCARCHGLDGKGNRRSVKSKPGLNLERSELLAAGERAEVYRRIAQGEGTMPAFEDKLTPEQIDTMVDLSFELAGLDPPPRPLPLPEPVPEPTS